MNLAVFTPSTRAPHWSARPGAKAPASARPFPWAHVARWTVWILLLLAPVAVILYHEVTAAQKRAPVERELERLEAAKARDLQKLERQLGRPIGSIE